MSQLGNNDRGHADGMLVTMTDEWSRDKWGFWEPDAGFTICRMD